MEPNETPLQIARGYERERRAYFSEIITGEPLPDQEIFKYLRGPEKRTKSTWKVRIERFAPVVYHLNQPIRPIFLAPAQRWMSVEEEKEIVSCPTKII